LRRKIGSILFALILLVSFGLVTAAPATAEGTLQVIPFGLTTGAYLDGLDEDSVAGWSTQVDEIAVLLDSGPMEPNEPPAWEGQTTDGDEARIVIPASSVGVTDLNSLLSIAWSRYSVRGYAPHVDVIVEVGEGTDALVFEYAYNGHEADVQATGYGTVYDNWFPTFDDDGEGPAVLDGSASAWLNSGPAGGPEIIKGTLADWKAGTVDGSVTGDSVVLRFEIEVDNWILASGSYIDDITINGVVYYGSIQDAVDSATGTIINVAPGTYVENVVIDKSLTLQGAGKELATITGAVTIMASDTLVDGFRVEGTVYVNDSLSAITGATISNNYITGDSYGVRVGYASECTISLLTIEDNDIIGNTNKGICFWKVDWEAGNLHDVTIRGNTINDNGSTGISTYGAGPYFITGNTVIGNAGNGISIKYDDGDVITGNIVTGNDAMGINMHQVTNCVVEGNTVSGQMSEEVVTTFWGEPVTAGKGSGIYVHEASVGNTVTLNAISGNQYGILVNSESGDMPSGNSINQNSITGNSLYGVLSVLESPPAPVDAQNNWWGQSSGPGDGVMGDVDYEPWLLTSDLEGAPYDKTLALPAGWSIVSPDAELESWTAADAEELKYAYDGGGFVTDFALDPVTPMFVKTAAGGGIGFNYAEASQGIFTTDLEAGWNLIGIPETDANPDAILSSIRLGSNNEVALATLVSQGNYNPSGQTFYESMLDLEDFPEIGLYPFDGYWANLNVAKEYGVIVVK